MYYRECKDCHEIKDIIQFTKATPVRSVAYYKHTCKSCTQMNKRHLRLLHKQFQMPSAGKCPLCSRFVSNGKWVLDHDHTSHLMRGWICNECNVGIGKAMENKIVLHNWIKHLERGII